MPKMKSKSGTKKRFRITGSGKIKRKRAFKRHNFSHKTSKRNRRLCQSALVSPGDEKQILRSLLAG